MSTAWSTSKIILESWYIKLLPLVSKLLC